MTALFRRAARLEAGTWRSIARWAARHPDVPAGAVPFAYHLQLVAPAVVLAAAYPWSRSVPSACTPTTPRRW